ncbi:hypothetical protein BC826DRAFT_1085735, partial [Russula brevipes]
MTVPRTCKRGGCIRRRLATAQSPTSSPTRKRMGRVCDNARHATPNAPACSQSCRQRGCHGATSRP